MLQKVIDQKNHAGDMPYFSEDELYDFQLDVNTYYTKNMQRYLSKFSKESKNQKSLPTDPCPQDSNTEITLCVFSSQFNDYLCIYLV